MWLEILMVEMARTTRQAAELGDFQAWLWLQHTPQGSIEQLDNVLGSPAGFLGTFAARFDSYRILLVFEWLGPGLKPRTAIDVCIFERLFRA